MILKFRSKFSVGYVVRILKITQNIKIDLSVNWRTKLEIYRKRQQSQNHNNNMNHPQLHKEITNE